MVLKNNYGNVVASNIPSFAGGMDLWGNSRNKMGLTTRTKGGKTRTLKDQFKPQDFGDGVLEFVSFRNQLTMGFEKAGLGGWAKRTGQGQGPFVFKFKRPKSQGSRPYVTYF